MMEPLNSRSFCAEHFNQTQQLRSAAQLMSDMLAEWFQRPENGDIKRATRAGKFHMLPANQRKACRWVIDQLARDPLTKINTVFDAIMDAACQFDAPPDAAPGRAPKSAPPEIPRI